MKVSVLSLDDNNNNNKQDSKGIIYICKNKIKLVEKFSLVWVTGRSFRLWNYILEMFEMVWLFVILVTLNSELTLVHSEDWKDSD